MPGSSGDEGAASPPVAEPEPPPSPRRSGAMAGIAIALVLLAVAVGAAVMLLRPTPQQQRLGEGPGPSPSATAAPAAVAACPTKFAQRDVSDAALSRLVAGGVDAPSPAASSQKLLAALGQSGPLLWANAWGMGLNPPPAERLVAGSCLSPEGQELYWRVSGVIDAGNPQFAAAPAAAFNTGWENGRLVVDQSPGIKGDRKALVVTLRGGGQVFWLVRCGNILFPQPPPGVPRGPTDNRPPAPPPPAPPAPPPMTHPPTVPPMSPPTAPPAVKRPAEDPQPAGNNRIGGGGVAPPVTDPASPPAAGPPPAVYNPPPPPPPETRAPGAGPAPTGPPPSNKGAPPSDPVQGDPCADPNPPAYCG